MTDISDADPAGDVCSTTTGETFSMSGKNIGDLLNAAGVSWGFFEGGFDLTRDQSQRNHGLLAEHHLTRSPTRRRPTIFPTTSRSNITNPRPI